MVEEVWNLAAALNQDVDESLSKILIAVGVEGEGSALVADTTSAADAVNVLGDATVVLLGEVEVDDMLDVLDVPTTAGDVGSNQDGATASAESAARSVSVRFKMREMVRELTWRPRESSAHDQRGWMWWAGPC